MLKIRGRLSPPPEAVTTLSDTGHSLPTAIKIGDAPTRQNHLAQASSAIAARRLEHHAAIVAIVQPPLPALPAVAFPRIAFRFVVVTLHLRPSRLRHHPNSPFILTSSSWRWEVCGLKKALWVNGDLLGSVCLSAAQLRHRIPIGGLRVFFRSGSGFDLLRDHAELTIESNYKY
ncbi:hypothetical protein Dimus_002689 [Dionaea muscipula]